VIPATTKKVYRETKRGWYGEYEVDTEISQEDLKFFPPHKILEIPVPERTITHRAEPCTDCFEEVQSEDLKVLSEEILKNPIFRKWLAEWMVTRNLNVLKSKSGTKGTADSILTELHKHFGWGSLNSPYKVSYYIGVAFGEADFIVDSFRALFSVTSEPERYRHLIPSHDSQLTRFRSEMLRFMGNEILGLEKTVGAVKWMDLLSAFQDELTAAQLDLQKRHADTPEHSLKKDVCHVCGFKVKEGTVTDHEASVLGYGIGFIPTNLLTPLCTENADGTMALGSINDATNLRMAIQKFQGKFDKFCKGYSPKGDLAKWHAFGSRPASQNTIRSLMNYRISSHQFMLLVKLQCKQSFMCRFNSDCTLTAAYNLTDLDFKTNVLNKTFNAQTISKIEAQVRRIYN